MILTVNDWTFDIDLPRTRDHAAFAALDHCTCAYCENYYRTVRAVAPELQAFLEPFGVDIDGPVEMWPFEPTFCLTGYRVFGRILRIGKGPMMAGTVPVSAQQRDGDWFSLEVGELELPWVLNEDPEEVISPANEPEFLDRMYRKWLERSIGSGSMIS